MEKGVPSFSMAVRHVTAPLLRPGSDSISTALFLSRYDCAPQGSRLANIDELASFAIALPSYAPHETNHTFPFPGAQTR